MNPTLSPICGPAGLGGGGGGNFGAAGLGGSTTGAGAVAVIVSTTAGSGLGSGGGGGAAVMRTIFSSTGAGLGGSGGGLGARRAATSGWGLTISCSSHSAVILSSELEGTLAAAMPIALACARISLFSRPSFFEMSYIRTGINFYQIGRASCRERVQISVVAV